MHTVPRNEDNFIHFDRPCPKYDYLYQYYSQQSPEVREIYQKYGHLFPYWAQMSGVEIYSLESIAFLYKKLMTDAEENKPIPDWAKNDLDKMKYIREVNYKIKSIPQLVRLKTGFLIKDIFDRFSQKMDGTLKPTNRTLWVYSGHSTTIKLLFNGLGLSSVWATTLKFENKKLGKELIIMFRIFDFFLQLSFPEYGCSLHWELYKTSENEYYIQLFYRKPNEENPTPLSLPGCGEKYTLEHIRSVYKDIIPNDFDTECKASYYDYDSLSVINWINKQMLYIVIKLKKQKSLLEFKMFLAICSQF